MKTTPFKRTLVMIFTFGLISLATALVPAEANCGGNSDSAACSHCPVPTVAAQQATTTLDERTRDALYQALADERGGVGQYGAIIKKFGEVRPFVNLVRAEDRHAEALISVMKTYHMPFPAPGTEVPTVPVTLKAACEEGVGLEKINVRMYDEFLTWVKEDDIRAVFTRLRDVSLHNHLPALQNCVAGGRGGRGGGRGPRGR